MLEKEEHKNIECFSPKNTLTRIKVTLQKNQS